MEVASPFQELEHSIQAVATEIEKVEDQLKREQDPEEKKYLWKKGEQLRKEKELLRELLVLKYNAPHGTGGSGAASALSVISSPVRPSKKFKASLFQGKTRCVAVNEIIGSERLETVAALNWLWLHLFGASQTLSTFLLTTHEKRYYPYVLAVLRAAALCGQGGVEVEVAGEEKNKTSVPDVQVIIDGKEVIPLDVKKEWGHGSVDDPQGIARNADSLNQLLSYVLEYNKDKVGGYSCTTAVFVRLQFVFFLRFHIRKNGASDLGSLELLEHVLRSGNVHKISEAALWEVQLINIADQLNINFGLHSKWFEETVGASNLPGPMMNRLQNTTLQELLPAYPPEGFHSLVKYFRTLAPQCFIPVEFVYESQDGTVEVGEVLASGPKSCVFATTGMSSVVKVSLEYDIEVERRVHLRADPADCIYLRKMVGHGRVVGSGPGLKFVELEGVGFPFDRKHVSTPEQIVKCWKEASSAVKALHGQRVFHRDIKPSNFMVMQQGTEQRLVLNDYDCSAHWEDCMTSDVGTDLFQSPLLEEGRDYCCRDDWLSLGLSFAHLLRLVPEPAEQRKLDSLQNLCSYPLIPEEMKVTMELALSQEHVCCHREFVDWYF